ncbi:MAG TPA: molecular chaperone TorD family protein [Dehalococcoidia bacterium]|nr:molecular chaperone TorD family protein [Dehalococcoidia bacterium]
MSANTPDATLLIDDATGARSELYGLFADAWEFPSREFHTRVEAGVLRDEVGALLGALPYRLDLTDDLAGLSDVGDYLPFQSAYIRLFDVGTVRPPCPLHDGEWGGPRKRAMEDVLRFYRFFGMKMDEAHHELPDHVTIEFEFMKVLAFLEGMARAQGVDAGSFFRAERDFLQRHPARWWPLLRRKLAVQEPPPFYASLTSIVGDVLAADLTHIKATIASAPAPGG